MKMNWTPLVIIAAIIAIFLWLKKSGQISANDAQAFLKKGAWVVDVREPGEFNSGHLPGAMLIPLGELESLIAQRVPDKNQVLLLHCQSGIRSAMARRKLLELGYPNAFNLGSLSRAKEIVDGSDGR